MYRVHIQGRQNNDQFLEYVTSFADLLLLELLQERCDPESGFHLPWLPVTDSELIHSLQPALPVTKASVQLREKWTALSEMLQIETVYQDTPRLVQLCWLYRMSPAWVLATVLAFIHRSAPKYEKAFALLQGDSGRRGTDVFLISAIAAFLGMEEPVMPQLSVESRLRMDLFEESDRGELLLQKHVFLWLHGEEDLQISLQGIFHIHPVLTDAANVHEKALEQAFFLAESQLKEKREPQLLLALQGRKGAGKTYFCRRVVEKLGYQLGSIHLSALLDRPAREWRHLLNAVFFSCRVHSCLPYLDLSGCAERTNAIHFVQEIAGEYSLLFLGMDADDPDHWGLSLQKISLDNLTMSDSLSIWKWMGSLHVMEENMDYEQLAGKYRLLPGTISEIFTCAEHRRRECGQNTIGLPLLISCIRECNTFTGNPLMEQINTVFGWNDLRVKPAVIYGMKLACAHLKHRFTAQEYLGSSMSYGSGVSVLMYGPPGTGKTMAAQVIANELQMELCRVDLSQVSSKYIGETEKNLEKIFREAEQSNVILFFDEADSLFGKRTEVKDSNDKYANQETSYILQRIESYNGMVILATNFARNFDPAFMRRITVSIQFDLPDENIRKQLWRDMLRNTELSTNETLMQELAEQFELTGSYIKSAVRNAVFMALIEERSLCTSDLIAAIKIEFEKMGKIVNASNFGTFFSYIT